MSTVDAWAVGWVVVAMTVCVFDIGFLAGVAVVLFSNRKDSI